MTVRIVTDSSCDLSAETIKHHQITVVPLSINFSGGGGLSMVKTSAHRIFIKKWLQHLSCPPLQLQHQARLKKHLGN